MQKVKLFFKKGFKAYFINGGKRHLIEMAITSFVCGIIFNAFQLDENNFFHVFYVLGLPLFLVWFTSFTIAAYRESRKDEVEKQKQKEKEK